jgi:hypothetical protein
VIVEEYKRRIIEERVTAQPATIEAQQQVSTTI